MHKLIYSSALNPERRVEHELVEVDEQGPFKVAITKTGLEFLLDSRSGKVQLIAGGNQRRTIAPGPEDLRSRHMYTPPLTIGMRGVVDRVRSA